MNTCDLRAEGAIGEVGDRDQREAQAGVQEDGRCENATMRPLICKLSWKTHFSRKKKSPSDTEEEDLHLRGTPGRVYANIIASGNQAFRSSHCKQALPDSFPWGPQSNLTLELTTAALFLVALGKKTVS